MQFLSTIDYRNRELILRKPVSDAALVDEALNLREDDLVAPMWLVATHLIFSTGSINDGEPKSMFIDTGLANAGALISKRTAKDAGISIDWTTATPGEAIGGTVMAVEIKVPSVTLGQTSDSITKRDVPGVVLKKGHQLFRGGLGFEVGGLISHDFFRDAALSFDFENMRIIVQRNDGTPASSRLNAQRLAI